jgi:ribosomal protein L35
MPKLKTKKSVVKKVKISKGGKLLRRYSKQNHYNSKQTGKFKRKKRGDKAFFKGDEKNILKALPNL